MTIKSWPTGEKNAPFHVKLTHQIVFTHDFHSIFVFWGWTLEDHPRQPSMARHLSSRWGVKMVWGRVQEAQSSLLPKVWSIEQCVAIREIEWSKGFWLKPFLIKAISSKKMWIFGGSHNSTGWSDGRASSVGEENLGWIDGVARYRPEHDS